MGDRGMAGHDHAGRAAAVGRRWAATLAAAVIAALAIAAPASAASKPSADTGGSKLVTYGSATLAGSINPQGSATSYYFQYGPTKAYGGQSAIASAGTGTKSVSV